MIIRRITSSFLSTIFFLSCTLHCVAQDSWYRDIRFEEDVRVTAFHMLTTDEDIYISGKATFTDSTGGFLAGAMSLSRHDYNGDVIWRTYLPWCNSANEGAISLINDTLIVSGHYLGVNKRRVFIDFFSIQGEHLKSDEVIYDTLFHEDHGFWNNGQILIGRNLFIQCETRNLDKVNTSITTKYNIDTGESEYWDIHQNPIGTPVTSGYDFCLDIDSNFVISTEMSKVGGDFGKDIKQITKFDQVGNILDTFFGPDHEMTSSVRPEMVVMKDGRYVILHNINEFIQSDVPQIVCIDPTSKEFCWTYDYESKLDTNIWVNISQIVVSDKGDIIGTGELRIRGLHGGGNYYVFRISPEGEMLWQKTFVRKDSMTEEYLNGGFRDIKELSDGSILAIGTDGDGRIAMMRLSADGCLMDKYCEPLNFLGEETSVSEIVINMLELYPNPATNKITIRSDNRDESHIKIMSIDGKVIVNEMIRQNNESGIEVDVSYLPKGLYFVLLTNDTHGIARTYTAKFVKQ